MLFLFSAYLFLTSLNNRESVVKKEKNLGIEVKLLSAHQTVIKNKNSAIKEFRKFIDKAMKLDLVSSGWALLETDINEPVTYLELEDILNQCTNNNSFYFKPEFIQIKKQTDLMINEKSTIKQDAIVEKKDVNLTLKGTFIVKNK